MTTVVAWDAVVDTTYTSNSALQGLYTYINGNSDFTVLDFGGLGSDGGWFVFKLDGFDWELWVGTSDTLANPWHADNTLFFDDDSLSYAFCPGGGWGTADDPAASGAMFSDSKDSDGGWSKINTGVTFKSLTFQCHVIYSVASGFFYCLARTSTTSMELSDGGLAVVEIANSTLGTDDAAPWMVLHGTPIFYDNNTSWFRTGITTADSDTIGALLQPDPTATSVGSGTAKETTPVSCYNYYYTDLGEHNQPNPITGQLDWKQIHVKCNTAGAHMYRGGLSTDHIRQMSAAHAGPRQMFDGGAWISVYSAGILIPWDGTTPPLV